MEDLLKMEGMPAGKTFTWEDDPLDALEGGGAAADGDAGGGVAAAMEPEPAEIRTQPYTQRTCSAREVRAVWVG